ncbi:MAG TPA: DUF3224 domain-containing protein [Candidatus Krumholzibacteria bacterium]|nr:DUF3224 domain-containing protein [Candidatus Krumholzibacteria bacterium]
MKHLFVLLVLVFAARPTGAAYTPKEATMTARGTFDVKVTPQPADDTAGGAFSRFFLAKELQGDLAATSHGHMMAAETAVEGSAAYVALERVTGTLHGKQGSFILQHRGTMRGGDYVMDVTVVPDSGTGELTGIAGRMTIILEGGKHSYELEYSIE